MLHEVAASDLDINYYRQSKFRKMLRRTEFIAADVSSIDLIEQTREDYRMGLTGILTFSAMTMSCSLWAPCHTSAESLAWNKMR